MLFRSYKGKYYTGYLENISPSITVNLEEETSVSKLIGILMNGEQVDLIYSENKNQAHKYFDPISEVLIKTSTNEKIPENEFHPVRYKNGIVYINEKALINRYKIKD